MVTLNGFDRLAVGAGTSSMAKLVVLFQSTAPSGTVEGEGRGGAGRAMPYHFYCWDLFSRAPVDMDKNTKHRP